MECPVPTPVPIIGPGVELKGNWRLTKKLGAGSFGEIYLAEGIKPDNKTEVAVKFESCNAPKPVLHLETFALVQMQGLFPYYCIFFFLEYCPLLLHQGSVTLLTPIILDTYLRIHIWSWKR